MVNDVTLRRTDPLKDLGIGDEVTLEIKCRVVSLVQEQVDVTSFNRLGDLETLGGEEFITFAVLSAKRPV